MTVQEAYNLAQDAYRAGRWLDSEKLCRQILATQPDHSSALGLLGLLAVAAQKPELAVQYLQKSILFAPSTAELHANLGMVFHSLGRFDEAITAYRRAIELQPTLAAAHNNLANTLMASGQTAAAIDRFNSAIRLQPDYPEALYNLGNLYLESGQYELAVELLRRATALRPNWPEAMNNLGDACARLGLWEQAVAAIRQSIALRPGQAEPLLNLAAAHHSQGQVDEAIACYAESLRLGPNFAEALVCLGNAKKDVGQIGQALHCYAEAIKIRPGFHSAEDNRIFSLYLHPDFDSATILREQQAWNQRIAAPLVKFQRPHGNDRSPQRRLRIGYVSADFRDHAVGRNLLPLLREHDRGQFEIFCYSNVDRPDGITAQFRAFDCVWREIARLNDQQAADAIRADAIDILVDLSLHTAGNRLLVFARKPAPVQVSFAGHPGGTGLPAIDWRLTDSHLDPPGADADYVERSFRLADSFWCYDSQAMQWNCEVGVAPLPAGQNGHVTFGCLHTLAKVNDPVLDLWSRVLRATPSARLLLMAPPGSARKRIFSRLGVPPERVDFTVYQPRKSYLAQFHRIDIGLDTFPYNGHTASLDAIWMGVPMITRIGRTVVGRAGWSQLSNLHLTELTARDDEQFVQIATELAADLPRLSELRQTLRQRILDSPLGDAKRFAQSVEAALRAIWADHCQRNPGPPSAETVFDHGNALLTQARWTEAARAFSRAVEIDPGHVRALVNLGAVLRRQRQTDEAAGALERALRIEPDNVPALCNLGSVYVDAARCPDAIDCWNRALELRPDLAAVDSNRVYSLYFHPGYDSAAILREHKVWNDRHANAFAAKIRPRQNDRPSGRRLRVGYVSPNFRENCQALFTVPLLANHDRDRFEIFCYSHSVAQDHVTDRIRSLVDQWRNSVALNDDDAAELIRRDEIDVLVDLTQHMSDNRLGIFARKPAPMQMCWLAYPGTTGLETIDFRLTDPHLDPPREHDADYVERSIRLPHTFWCYDPSVLYGSATAALTPLPAERNGYVTFSCLNNFSKLNDGVLDLWGKVLSATPRSRLLLMAPQTSRRNWVLDKLAAHDVSGDRIEFVPFRPAAEYIATYHRADLGLDTIPYNGHTTSLDSFYMGVPVMTRLGNTVVGRAGWSQLSNLGLRELAAHDDGQFVKIATELAADLPRLAELRRTLRGRMMDSPLMNAAKFARDVEAALLVSL